MATSKAIINIEVLDKQARKALTNLQYEQFPYALAKTLVEVAKSGVRAVRRETKAKFKLHGGFVPKGISSEPRSFGVVKRQVKSQYQGTTVIFTKERISSFMPIHEDGGTRRPSSAPSKTVSGGKDRGKSFALPGTKAPINITKHRFKTSTGKTAKRWHPRTLLESYTGTYRGGRKASSAGGSKKKPFIIRAKGSGVPMIVCRTSKKRTPLQVLYVFAKSASYQGIWGFETTVRGHVESHFMTRLRRNVMVAAATAR